MQNCQLHFFSIITVVNGTPVTNLPGTSTQDNLDRALFEIDEVNLQIYLPPYTLRETAKALSLGKSNKHGTYLSLDTNQHHDTIIHKTKSETQWMLHKEAESLIGKCIYASSFDVQIANWY